MVQSQMFDIRIFGVRFAAAVCEFDDNEPDDPTVVSVVGVFLRHE